MKVCVIIPAAGRSKRFGDSDKLAQDLGGRALLLRTVELFAKREEVASIVVAGPPDTLDEFREKYAATLGFHGASVVAGGRAERWETVRNALEAVPADATHIAVHDAARPAAGRDLLDRIFEAARQRPAVIPALALSGTVKRVGSDEEEIGEQDEDAVADLILGDAGRLKMSLRAVVETVDRTGLFEVQTPQVFEAGLLCRAYAEADPAGATDDAALVERLGETVWVVDGDPRNIKVTRPEDVPLLRAILGLKPPAERPVHKRF